MSSKKYTTYYYYFIVNNNDDIFWRAQQIEYYIESATCIEHSAEQNTLYQTDQERKVTLWRHVYFNTLVTICYIYIDIDVVLIYTHAHI